MGNERKVEFIEVVDQGLKEVGSSIKKLIVDVVIKFADILGEDFSKKWDQEKNKLIQKTKSKAEK